MILAYFIADMFMNTYSMAMDVMMHCYLSDLESGGDDMWAKNPKATHLHSLAATIGKNKPKDEPKDIKKDTKDDKETTENPASAPIE